MKNLEKLIINIIEEIQSKKLLSFLFFLFITLIIYSPTFTNLNFFWDDERFIFSNPAFLQAPFWYSFWDIKSDFYKSWPLGYSLFWVLIKQFSLSSIAFYKSLNLFIHALNSFLVFYFLKKINLKHAFLSAMIFAIHPLSVETISWVFQLLTLTSFLFFIISLILFQNFLSRSKVYFLLFSLLFFLFSLWTKSIAILTPFLFLTFVWIVKGNFKKYLAVIPFFVLSLFLGITNINGTLSLAQKNSKNPQFNKNFFNVIDEGIKIVIPKGSGKIVKDSSTQYFDSIYNRNPKAKKIDFNKKEIFGQGVWHYFSKSIAPINLSYIYPNIKTPLIFILLPIVALIIIPIFYAIKTSNRFLFLIPSLSLTLLTPYLGVTFITFFYWSPVSDRYTYFFLLTLPFISNFFLTLNSKTIKVLICFYILLLSLLSFNYGLRFNNPTVLYSSILEYKPHPVIYSLLFEEYLLKLDAINARKILEEGIKKYPDDSSLYIDRYRLDALEESFK